MISSDEVKGFVTLRGTQISKADIQITIPHHASLNVNLASEQLHLEQLTNVASVLYLSLSEFPKYSFRHCSLNEVSNSLKNLQMNLSDAINHLSLSEQSIQKISNDVLEIILDICMLITICLNRDLLA